MLTYARAKGGDLPGHGTKREGRLRPQLAFLLGPAQAPRELEHLRTFEDGQRKTLVYRFR